MTWLGFNGRVLEEAQDPQNAVLELARFLGIFASNLDEFFMIRVASIRDRIRSGVGQRSPAGKTQAERLRAVQDRVQELTTAAASLWEQGIVPGLRDAGIRFVADAELEPGERAFVERLFTREVLPVLTPAAIAEEVPFHVSSISRSISRCVSPSRARRSASRWCRCRARRRAGSR